MPTYRTSSGWMHLKLSGKAKRNAPAPCREILLREGQLPVRCCAMSTMLCDWPVGVEGETCSLPMCSDHGREVAPNTHLCVAHMTLWVSQSPMQQRLMFSPVGAQQELLEAPTTERTK